MKKARQFFEKELANFLSDASDPFYIPRLAIYIPRLAIFIPSLGIYFLSRY